MLKRTNHNREENGKKPDYTSNDRHLIKLYPILRVRISLQQKEEKQK